MAPYNNQSSTKAENKAVNLTQFIRLKIIQDFSARSVDNSELILFCDADKGEIKMTVTEYTVLTSALVSMGFWLSEQLGALYNVMFNLPFFK